MPKAKYATRLFKLLMFNCLSYHADGWVDTDRRRDTDKDRHNYSIVVVDNLLLQ